LHVVYYIIGWQKMTRFTSVVDTETSPMQVSVVIPARNEANNILNILKDLESQLFSDFEVIVIDDCSEDSTYEVVKQYAQSTPLKLQLIKQTKLISGLSPKKSAIHRGVESSSNEIIITTDADCSVGPYWIHSMANMFQKESCEMVCGPVQIRKPKGLMGYLQYLEMAAVMFYSAITMYKNKPTMANGANLAFKRSRYLELGYGKNSEHPSGDDMFLMEQFLMASPHGVYYNLSRHGLVETAAVNRWQDYLEQRKRWSSKWRSFSLPYTRRLALTIALFNLNKILGMVLLIFVKSTLPVLLPLLILVLLEGLLLVVFLIHFKLKVPFGSYLLLSPLYPFISLLTGITSTNGRYSWKGRHFSVK